MRVVSLKSAFIAFRGMKSGNYVTRLFHAVRKDIPDRQMEVCSAFHGFIACYYENTLKCKCCILCSRRLIEPIFLAVSQASFTYQFCRTLLYLQSTDCFWRMCHTFNRMMCYLITVIMWEISSLFIFLKDQ